MQIDVKSEKINNKEYYFELIYNGKVLWGDILGKEIFLDEFRFREYLDDLLKRKGQFNGR